MIENTSQTQFKMRVTPSIEIESCHPTDIYAYIFNYLNAILDIQNRN